MVLLVTDLSNTGALIVNLCAQDVGQSFTITPSPWSERAGIASSVITGWQPTTRPYPKLTSSLTDWNLKESLFYTMVCARDHLRIQKCRPPRFHIFHMPKLLCFISIVNIIIFLLRLQLNYQLNLRPVVRPALPTVITKRIDYLKPSSSVSL